MFGEFVHVVTRCVSNGGRFLVFLCVLELYLLVDAQVMGARGACKLLQGGCESVYRVSMLLHISRALWAILVGA